MLKTERIRLECDSDAQFSCGAPLQWPKAVIRMGFLNGSDSERALVCKTCRMWETSGFRFEVVDDLESADVRIRFSKSGASWAYTGPVCIHDTQPTMNLAGNLFSKLGRAIILHEFGHVLGFQHEHFKPDYPYTLEMGSVYETNKIGMNKHTTDAKFRSSRTGVIPPYDPLSIMHYSLPHRKGTTDTETPLNFELSKQDIYNAKLHCSNVIEQRADGKFASKIASKRIASKDYEWSIDLARDVGVVGTEPALVTLRFRNDRGQQYEATSEVYDRLVVPVLGSSFGTLILEMEHDAEHDAIKFEAPLNLCSESPQDEAADRWFSLEQGKCLCENNLQVGLPRSQIKYCLSNQLEQVLSSIPHLRSATTFSATSQPTLSLGLNNSLNVIFFSCHGVSLPRQTVTGKHAIFLYDACRRRDSSDVDPAELKSKSGSPRKTTISETGGHVSFCVAFPVAESTPGWLPPNSTLGCAARALVGATSHRTLPDILTAAQRNLDHHAEQWALALEECRSSKLGLNEFRFVIGPGEVESNDINPQTSETGGDESIVCDDENPGFETGDIFYV